MTWTAPRTWAAGETVTAAQLNEQIRDNQLALSEWATDWTPTWTGASGNPALGNGTIEGRYILVGDLVHFYIYLTIGSTTTLGSGGWRFDLPVLGVARRWMFDGMAYDTSTTDEFPVLAIRTASDEISLRKHPTSAGGALINVNSGAPFAWANGDLLYIAGTYEKA